MNHFIRANRRKVAGLAVALLAAWLGLWVMNNRRWVSVGPLPPGEKFEGTLIVSLQRDFGRIDAKPGGGQRYTPAHGTTVRLDPVAGTARPVFRRLAYQVRASPDGRWLAYQTDSQEVMIQPIDGGEPRRVPGLAGTPVWAPDGRSFLCGDGATDARGTWRVSVPDLGRTRFPLPDGHFAHDWSRDGRRLLTATAPEPTVCVLHAMAPGGSDRTTLATGGYNFNARFSPDGGHVAFMKSEPRPGPWATGAWVMRSDGTGARKLADGVLTSDQVCWSPDGRTLLIKSGLDLSLIDLEGSNRRPIHLEWKADRPMFALPPGLGGSRNDARWMGGVEWLRR